jgi:hypothetical protein
VVVSSHCVGRSAPEDSEALRPAAAPKLATILAPLLERADTPERSRTGFAARLPREITAIRRAVVSVNQFIVENGNCIFK